MAIWMAIVWGVIGGFARAMIGLRKAVSEKRKIVWWRFFWTLGEAAGIGAILGGLIGDVNPIYNFLAGAGGTDIIDGARHMLKITPAKIGAK